MLAATARSLPDVSKSTAVIFTDPMLMQIASTINTCSLNILALVMIR